MNKTEFERHLGNESPAGVAVGRALHQRVMHAVAGVSIEPSPRRPGPLIATLGLTAVAVLVVALVRNVAEPLQQAPQSAATRPAGDLIVRPINQRVQVLESRMRLPEQALRQELRRLQSDLRRFHLSAIEPFKKQDPHSVAEQDTAAG